MSEDPFSEDPSVPIELSRRKGGRSSDDPGGRRPQRDHALPWRARVSMTEALRAGAPYLTMFRIALARVARDRMARAGFAVLSMFALVSIFADLLASDLPIACRSGGVLYLMPNVTHPAALEGTDCARMKRERLAGDWLLPPLVAHGPVRPAAGSTDAAGANGPLRAPLTEGHPLGTDAFGRDVFARVVHGARTALGLGIVTSLVLVSVGVTLGALAGFFGGIVDGLVARAVESLTAIPTLVLVLIVGAVLPHATLTLMATIALTRWTELARLVRAEVLLALRTDYVTAARALGASASRVLWRHVLPNAVAPAIVAAAFALAWVVLVEATVDFLLVPSASISAMTGAASSLGRGASWGEAMGEARTNPNAWWLVAFPGAALLATLIALNLVGEGARNALDPRLRGGEPG